MHAGQEVARRRSRSPTEERSARTARSRRELSSRIVLLRVGVFVEGLFVVAQFACGAGALDQPSPPLVTAAAIGDLFAARQ